MKRQFLLALMFAQGVAHATEYRAVELDNSRTIFAQIQKITGEAITLGIPQGTMTIAPSELVSMEPLSTEDYQRQAPWRVVILPFSADEAEDLPDARTAQMLAQRALSDIPAVVSGTPEEIPGDIRAADRRSLAACRTDLLCAIRAGEEAKVDVVVLGEIRRGSQGKELRMGALWVAHPKARKRASISLKNSPIDQRREIYSAQFTILFLDPPSEDQVAAAPQPVPVPVPAPVVTKPMKPAASTPASIPKQPRGPLAPSTVRALAWTPIPGLAQLARKDSLGFAGSLGVTGVGAALGIGMAGQATYTKGQFITMSVLSTYAATVLANHLFLPANR